jgi:hypothetical protein
MHNSNKPADHGIPLPPVDRTDAAMTDWAMRVCGFVAIGALSRTPTADGESALDPSKPFGISTRTGPTPTPLPTRGRAKVPQWR